MLGKTFSWKGFEAVPAGCLLEQIVDLSAEMGFAYERSCKFYKDYHHHDRMMLIFPRGTTTMDVRTRNPEKKVSISSEDVLIVPKFLVHDDQGTSSIYDTMAFYPSDEMIATAAAKIGVPSDRIEEMTKDCCMHVPRTEKLEQLAQDYFFEKVLSRNSVDEEALRFLGRRLLEEVMTLGFFPPEKEAPASEKPVDESTTARALRYIEANLFEPLEVPHIAERANASVSTLLRKFKAEVGSTPYTYIKNRRLEEAMRLLKSGSHPVGDVALLVGYENFGAFSDAFKEKYGVPPSHFKGT